MAGDGETVNATNANRTPIDASSPLYIHASDVHGVSLSPKPIFGVGFSGWKRSVMVSLSARNKLAFIDGSCPKPSDDSPNLGIWNRCNNIVISWLTSSLSPDIVESILYFESAEEIWEHLNKRYGTINGTRVFELKRELASTVQGPLDIAAYFNKLQKLWDELRITKAKKSIICTCAAKTELQKEEEENKLYQFPMGLNEAYVSVRSNILMINPLPSLDIAYNILLQDGNQRQINPTSTITPESASFNAHSNYSNQQNSKNPSTFYSSNQKQIQQKVNFGQNKDNLKCTYCKRFGHLIGDCPKLKRNNSSDNPYNQNQQVQNNNNNINFRYNKNKGKGSASNVMTEIKFDNDGVDVSESVNANFGQSSTNPGLSQEQDAQLISLLQQSHISDIIPQSNLMVSANFAGPFYKEATDNWYVGQWLVLAQVLHSNSCFSL